jgi:hypothetical protein
MKARLVNFGEIEVEGKRYMHNVVINGGKVGKRTLSCIARADRRLRLGLKVWPSPHAIGQYYGKRAKSASAEISGF